MNAYVKTHTSPTNQMKKTQSTEQTRRTFWGVLNEFILSGFREQTTMLDYGANLADLKMLTLYNQCRIETVTYKDFFRCTVLLEDFSVLWAIM